MQGLFNGIMTALCTRKDVVVYNNETYELHSNMSFDELIDIFDNVPYSALASDKHIVESMLKQGSAIINARFMEWINK